MRLLLLPLLGMLLLPTHALAQQLVVSEAPDSVSIAIYRAPGRGADEPIDRRYPRGYALITETRTVDLPQGEAKLRFEGVAGGMYPESAIISDLPQGVIEKNRDARLLSPAGLVDAYLRRNVTLQRTDPATGVVRMQEAVLRTGSQGGVVLETEDGFEALRCAGLPERLLFDEVPADLSPRPTLSVLTTSDRPVRATLQLTYLAEGFDWEANYIVEARASGHEASERGADPDRQLSLFAWLTVANGGDQSFVDAQLLTIAGEPNRVRAAAQPQSPPVYLRLQCWPDDTTSDIPLRRLAKMGYAPPPPPPPPAPAMMMAGESITVTGSRMSADSAIPVSVLTAEQEDLGDLKLYRVPEPITVAAQAQKQVAMIAQPQVRYRSFYSGTFTADDLCCGDGLPRPLSLTFRAENEPDEGLGLPLPQGRVALYEPSEYGPLLVGETYLGDKAVGQEIELDLGPRSNVQWAISTPDEQHPRRFDLLLTNAGTQPVDVEIEVPFELRRGRGFDKIDGVPTWKGTVPPEGGRRLSIEIRKPR